MAMQSTSVILGDIYDAWRAQDLDLLASYLPIDFSHSIYIPQDIHPLGGHSQGKKASVARLGLIAAQFDILRFDTSGLMTDRSRAAVEIPIRYRHRETGVPLETKIVNFWIFEDGWPVQVTEYHDVGRIQAFSHAVAAVTPL